MSTSVTDKLFSTDVGLSYFRQVRDGKTKLPRWIANYWMGDSTKEDQRLAILHDEIQKIEGHAQYLGSIEDCITTRLIAAEMQIHNLEKYRRVPFEALPCHRDIVVEIQGEEWVLEKEKEHEKWASSSWTERSAFSDARQEHQKKKLEIYYQHLRDI